MKVLCSKWSGKIINYIIWAALGVILLIGELHTLTFVLAIFGAAAIIIAIPTKAGVTAGAGTQFALLSAFSLILIYILRSRIRKRPAIGAIPPDYQGQKVRVVKIDILQGQSETV
ncbi:MAG: hypothetical protein M0Z52_12210 [Actinomycetota bacterium]|nr:hypothetical protein [Actinomycetota bacterium]